MSSVTPGATQERKHGRQFRPRAIAVCAIAANDVADAVAVKPTRRRRHELIVGTLLEFVDKARPGRCRPRTRGSKTESARAPGKAAPISGKVKTPSVASGRFSAGRQFRGGAARSWPAKRADPGAVGPGADQLQARPRPGGIKDARLHGTFERTCTLGPGGKSSDAVAEAARDGIRIAFQCIEQGEQERRAPSKSA